MSNTKDNQRNTDKVIFLSDLPCVTIREAFLYCNNYTFSKFKKKRIKPFTIFKIFNKNQLINKETYPKSLTFTNCTFFRCNKSTNLSLIM